MVELNKIINKRAINTFNPDFTEMHRGMNHKIFKIPAGFTMLDAVSYILNNNPNHIADFLMKLQYNVPEATDIVNILKEGIKNKTICLTCLRNEVQTYMHSN